METIVRLIKEVMLESVFGILYVGIVFFFLKILREVSF